MIKSKKVNVLFQKVVDHFLGNHITNSKRISEKIETLCKYEDDTIILSPNEIMEFINFSIYMEKQLSINETLGNKEYKVNTFSEILENGIEVEQYENEENTYTEKDVKDFILEVSEKLNTNIFEKNENIIITFL